MSINENKSHSNSGLQQIWEWTEQSLKRRLNKSLSHDWFPEKSAHKFPLRQYYVQLEWKKKIRTAVGSDRVTLTSLHDLVKQLTSETHGNSEEGAPNSDDTLIKHKKLVRLQNLIKKIRGKRKAEKTPVTPKQSQSQISTSSVLVEGKVLKLLYLHYPYVIPD